jgi:hypothetical protein
MVIRVNPSHFKYAFLLWFARALPNTLPGAAMQ